MNIFSAIMHSAFLVSTPTFVGYPFNNISLFGRNPIQYYPPLSESIFGGFEPDCRPTFASPSAYIENAQQFFLCKSSFKQQWKQTRSFVKNHHPNRIPIEDNGKIADPLFAHQVLDSMKARLQHNPSWANELTERNESIESF